MARIVKEFEPQWSGVDPSLVSHLTIAEQREAGECGEKLFIEIHMECKFSTMGKAVELIDAETGVQS